MTQPVAALSRRLVTAVLFMPPLATAGLVAFTIRHHEYNEPWFIYTTYYALAGLLSAYACVLMANRKAPLPREWIRDNWAGIAVTLAVCTITVLAVAPGFRVLADEANLVGVSKNLFFHRTANFAVTGKWYFENYWNLNETTDRRPALFPFLVNLVHLIRGYRAENAFHLNALLFVVFVFTSYRFAKRLGGELYGLAAAVAVGVSPITLLCVRSAGFDFLSALMLLIALQTFHAHATEPSPRSLAELTLSLCLVAHVRYEGWAIAGVTGAVLLAFRLVKRSHLNGFGVVYSLAPLFVLPRYWQLVAKANDAEQPLRTSWFTVSSFVQNTADYFRMALHPFDVAGPHSPMLLLLGVGGCALIARSVTRGLRARDESVSVPFLVYVLALLGTEAVITFSYFWGRPQQPSCARLFLWLDTSIAFAGAWLLTVLGRRCAVWFLPLRRRSGVPVTMLAAAVLFALHLPVASEARIANALILTRQAAQTWRFFDSLGDKRILILSDRPGLFTIMDYGAQDISTADYDRGLLYELSRHLYNDIYLVQEVDLATGQPLPAFAPWPDIEKETLLEFQSTDSTSVRIARVVKKPGLAAAASAPAPAP